MIQFCASLSKIWNQKIKNQSEPSSNFNWTVSQLLTAEEIYVAIKCCPRKREKGISVLLFIAVNTVKHFGGLNLCLSMNFQPIFHGGNCGFRYFPHSWYIVTGKYILPTAVKFRLSVEKTGSLETKPKFVPCTFNRIAIVKLVHNTLTPLIFESNSSILLFTIIT